MLLTYFSCHFVLSLQSHVPVGEATSTTSTEAVEVGTHGNHQEWISLHNVVKLHPQSTELHALGHVCVLLGYSTYFILLNCKPGIFLFSHNGIIDNSYTWTEQQNQKLADVMSTIKNI